LTESEVKDLHRIIAQGRTLNCFPSDEEKFNENDESEEESLTPDEL
jgi:hypothetical protein